MFDAKYLADLITIGRAFLAFLLAWLGLAWGRSGLVGATIIMLLDWTGDFVDGKIARLSHHPRQTWIGSHDVQVDVLVSLGLSVFLLGSGLVNQWVAFWYFVVWIIVFWRLGPDFNLLMLFQAPIYLYFIVIAVREAPNTGQLMIFWILLALAINWRRFYGQVVPDFIHGVHALLDNGKHSRL